MNCIHIIYTVDIFKKVIQVLLTLVCLYVEVYLQLPLMVLSVEFIIRRACPL